MDAVAEAVHANYPELPLIPVMSAEFTDCTFYGAARMPCYGTSGLNRRPTDDFAHGLNERIPVSAISGALLHWDVLIRRVTR